MRRAAKHFGYSHRDIVSGAGHDACYIWRASRRRRWRSRLASTELSHNESEDMKPDWAMAVNVLMHAVLEKAEIVSKAGNRRAARLRLSESNRVSEIGKNVHRH